MIGGWQLYIAQAARDMSGNQRNGFQTDERFITVTIADTISEHNKNGAAIAAPFFNIKLD